MPLGFDRQGKPTALSQRIKSLLPSPFSPPPGAESFAFFTVDYRANRFVGQHSHERLETTVLAENAHPFEKRVRLPHLVVES
jgi:hypothetical protein